MKYALTSNLDTKISKVLLIVVSSAFTLLVILTLFSCNGRDMKLLSVSVASPPFDFVPSAPRSLSDCDDLFGPNTAANTFQLSSEYHTRFRDFEASVNESTVDEEIEGYSLQQPTQHKVIHYLASRSTVRSICETGFNLGHSAFNYLTANRNAVVHSFDLGIHRYAHKMAAFMRHHFPQRFFAHFGDSTLTVPKFAQKHPHHRCHLMFVDGGHTYSVAMADLLNLAAMADVNGGNVIIFDDYPTLKAFTRPFGWAWEDMRRWGYVREMVRCSFKEKQFQRGFVIGTVARRPRL